MHAKYFPEGCKELIKLVSPRMLLMAMEIYMKLSTTGKGLSSIGDPVTLKRKHAECEETQEPQKDKAQEHQQMLSAVDLLLSVAEKAMAYEKEATDKEDLDDDDSEEEVGGLVINESDDDDDDK